MAVPTGVGLHASKILGTLLRWLRLLVMLLVRGWGLAIWRLPGLDGCIVALVCCVYCVFGRKVECKVVCARVGGIMVVVMLASASIVNIFRSNTSIAQSLLLSTESMICIPV